MFFAFKVLFEFVISFHEKYNELKNFIDIIDQRKLQEQKSKKKKGCRNSRRLVFVVAKTINRS